ncbi:MAG: NfeD family protein [Alishewanella aestuarii]|uniref:NfeD family protein n=1 Tax=Alishewanella sp. BS5-314 TaxID=2755587 RepID=UPI0021BB0019|nr:NfeD family protein [Alishewanella sp. BS5-314]MCT8127515.1 NfeD family protein [Alishewanella sp. BS5-314]
MSTAMIWIIIGVALILSELLATSIVAVFLGLAAIVVGVLLQLGWIESASTQYTVFGIVSLVLLFTARGRFKRWFVGFTADKGEHPSRFTEDIGDTATVLADFQHGRGRVVLNGVQWDAQSSDELKAGDLARVVANEGIHLTVVKVN